MRPELKVFLTPAQYLPSSENKYLRARLVNGRFDEGELKLEVFHDIGNNDDPLALEVYCNELSIGYISKDKNRE